MIVRTTAARGDERLELAGEGPDYETAKAALDVPDGWQMLFISIDR
jgi:hypothetical protein